MSERKELLRRLWANRPLAHEVLFRHRHPQKAPPFHVEMIQDFHSPISGIVDIVFRGAAKSTIAEEAIALMALFREFKNCLIIGENYDRAASRLAAIKREFETNEMLHQAFGEVQGDTWGQDRLVLASGICIQALGKGQSLRGIKHYDQRPDLVFGDDLENREDTRTPEARAKTLEWWLSDLIPAMDITNGRWRMAATTTHPECLPEVLGKQPGVVTHRYPVKFRDEKGDWAPAWKERFTLEAVDRLEQGFVSSGKKQHFDQEYMCAAEAPELKAFKKEQLQVVPQVRTWQNVYSMTDPARTVRKGSDTTGHVVWSWIGAKLVIWDAWGDQIMPDEIVNRLFQTWETYHPAMMGVEEDGLNEFLLQPIRTEMVKRSTPLPLKPMKAPVGKIDFIRSLQPYFMAREVEFAKPMPELEKQLLGFPTGHIDIPNALAYALRMRPGAPVYDDFGARHVLEDLRPLPGRPVWLCLNATSTLTTGILLQVLDGSVRVFADYLREGDPAEHVRDIIAAANIDAGGRLRVAAGPKHFDTYNNVGMAQAIRKIPMEITPGVAPDRARSFIRSLLQRERQGMPMLLVSSEARWTTNALAGGYSRVLLKGGILADYAEEGAYRVLIEGLESYLGLMELGRSTDEDGQANLNAVTPGGVPYRSMLRK